MRQRARRSAQRFTDRVFAESWLKNMDKLVRLQVERTKKRTPASGQKAEIRSVLA
jgi:alpha-1,2-mannosyltransferase